MDSPLYFVYRSPTQNRKFSRGALKVQEQNDEKTMKSNEEYKEINDAQEKHSKRSSSGTNILTEQRNTSPDGTTKEVVPRELIEARSAFKTIKIYCNNLIRGSANNTASNRDDNRKNTIPLNFFAKPVVDRPISIP